MKAWLKIGLKEMGIKEVEGSKHNPRILEYHRATTLMATSDEVSWCSAFACWCMEKAGIQSPRNAQARSWVSWGEMIPAPVLGCAVVFWREKPDSWKGHVGFYIFEENDLVYVLGGNQENSVSIKPYKKEQVLAYVWPKGEKYEQGN